jgi:uncharacterized spore protein YtfJ
MVEETNKLSFKEIGSFEEGLALLRKTVEAGDVRAAFGDPVTAGEQTVISVAEVSHGMGFGYGAGYGEGAIPSGAEGQEPIPSTGGGSGGGGGGGAFSRPVAALIVSPEGVRVEPIVDVTKVMLAFFTMFGTIILTIGKLRKAAK